MRSVTCPCEAVFEADLPDSVDLDARPGAFKEILEGSFLSVRCPECGSVVKPDLPVRITSESRGMDIQVVPEMERYAFYRGAVPLPSGSEAVIGYRELVERIRTVKEGVSPGALEVIKYLLLARAQQDAPEADIVIEYVGRQENSFVFDVWGMKPDQAGVIRVPQAVYDKTLSELAKKTSEEPFSRIFAGTYRSVRALEADPEEDAK